MAAEDKDFWSEQVKDKWLAFSMHFKSKKDLVGDGGIEDVVVDHLDGGTGDERPTKRPRLEKPPPRRYTQQKPEKPQDKIPFEERIKTQRCFAWNRAPDGCAEPCPNNRLHECEACGSKEHRSCQKDICPLKGRTRKGKGKGK